MSKLRCPYCDRELEEINKDDEVYLYCPKHRLAYDLRKHVVQVMDDAPQSVIDSVRLLNEISTGECWLSYGPHNIMEDEFRYDKTIVLTPSTPVDSKRKPEKYDVMISYRQYLSRFIKQDLMWCLQLSDAGSISGPMSLIATNPTESLITELCLYKKDIHLTDAQSRALTAIVADSPIHAAATMMGQVTNRIEDMSPSSVLISYIYGIPTEKFEEFNTKYITKSIVKIISEQAAHCSLDNLKRRRRAVKFSDYVTSLAIPTAQEMHRASFTPELELLPGNDWYFWKGDLIQNVSNILNDVNNDNVAYAVCKTGDLLRTCWETWKVPFSLNPTILLYAKTCVPDKDDATAVYLTYWNILSERLERRYRDYEMA